MTLTLPESIAEHAVGFAWQTAEGTPASIADAQILTCEDVDVDPRFSYVHPAGTTGSSFQKDTHQLVAREPMAKIKMYGGVHQIAPIIESALRGTPTVAGGDITEAGDTGDLVSAWTLNGLSPGQNSDISPSTGLATLYVQVEDETPSTGRAQVSLYKDSARTELVARGDAADGGTATLAAQNGSNLTGTVLLANPVGASSVAITLSVGKVTFAHAVQPSRYFTLWRDSGKSMERLDDCVVVSMMISGADKGPLYLEAEIIAKNYTKLASGLTAALPRKDFLVFQDVTVYTDTGGDNDLQFPADFELMFATNVRQYLGSAATPQKLIAGRVDLSGKMTLVPAAGSDELIDRAIADTEDAWEFKATDGTRTITITLPHVKILNPKKASASANELSDVAIEFMPVEDAAKVDDPFAVVIEG